MVGRMPVFGCYFDDKWEVEEGVDKGSYVAAIGNCETSILSVILDQFRRV